MVEPASRGGAPAESSDTSSARRKTPFGLSMTVGGRYRRGACIAKGGSSTVHRATDLTTGAEVALKSFHVHRAFDASLLPSLERGRAIADRVGADVMVPILDLGADDDGTPFVIMPLVPGDTLGSQIERGQPTSDTDAIAVAARLLASLDALHACGVTHGDLSPDNVIVLGTRAILMDHEGIDAIGAPRASRVTEGFGREGGVREPRDDHRALVAIVHAITARPLPATVDDGAIDRVVLALRSTPPDRDGAYSEGALTILGWTPGQHTRATATRWIALGAVVIGIVSLALAWLALHGV